MSQTPYRQQAECPRTNRLSYQGSSYKNLKSRARPSYKWAFIPLVPLDLIANWLLHLALAIYMFAFVHFDALAQESDIRIESSQVIFLCSIQDSNLGSLRHLIASRLNAHSQTDWGIEKNLNSTTRSHVKWAFSPRGFTADWLSHLALAISCFLLLILMLWHIQLILESKGDKLSFSAECWVRFWESADT